MTEWRLRESPLRLGVEFLEYLSFAYYHAPSINNFEKTSMIYAWVFWSLRYEWFFYLALPLLAVSVRPKSFSIWTFFSACGVLGSVAITSPLASIYLAAFLPGLLAAAIVKNMRLKALVGGFWGSLAFAVFSIIGFSFFDSSRDYWSIFFLGLAFIIVACGNKLFGVLTCRAAKFLGEISYSIYLIHPLILFITLNFLITPKTVRTFSVAEYWLMMAGMSVVLLCLCYFTFVSIERPFIKSTNTIYNWLVSFRKPVIPAAPIQLNLNDRE